MGLPFPHPVRSDARSRHRTHATTPAPAKNPYTNFGLSYSRARALFSYIFSSPFCPFGRCPPKERSFQARPVQALPGKLLKSFLSGNEVPIFPCNLPGLPSEPLLLDYTFNYTPFPSKSQWFMVDKNTVLLYAEITSGSAQTTSSTSSAIKRWRTG